MLAEVERASSWLGDELFAGSETRAAFVESVRSLLVERFAGHWHPEEPHRGCAFRALTSNGSLDPLIAQAVKQAGGGEPALARNFILWVNPGEVKLLDNDGKMTWLFHPGGSPNPYSKPRVRIDPTRLCGIVESPTLPQSSQPNGLSPLAQTFAPSSQSDAGSDSDGEQAASQRRSPPPPPLPPPLPPGLLPAAYVPSVLSHAHPFFSAPMVGPVVPMAPIHWSVGGRPALWVH